MRYWWVNQNQTYRAEVRGSFMWSPKQNANGARNQFYENMREVSPGDIVFSFCDTRIKAIGVVTGRTQRGPKPDFGSVGANWSKEGWFVPVDYCVLNNQIRPKDHVAILRPFLPAKYSPLQESGDGLQSVYLAEVPQSLADALIAIIGQAYWDAYSTIAVLQTLQEPTDFEAIPTDATRPGPTFREQLVRARRGQGVFRANVLLREEACRVTHVNEPRHLTATYSVAMIITTARAQQRVPAELPLAPATVHRLLSRHGLMARPTDAPTSKDRRRFSYDAANELWMSDVMHGPTVLDAEDRRRHKTYLIALLDDATRLIPYAAFTRSETVTAFLPVFERAILRRGIPGASTSTTAARIAHATSRSSAPNSA